MVLDNYVKLVPGVPKRLHFTAGGVVAKTLVDPLHGRAKGVNTLEMHVDREDGVEVSRSFSVTSEKLAQSLAPYLDPSRLPLYDFIITMTGAGFTRSYVVEARPTGS